MGTGSQRLRQFDPGFAGGTANIAAFRQAYGIHRLGFHKSKHQHISLSFGAVTGFQFPLHAKNSRRKTPHLQHIRQRQTPHNKPDAGEIGNQSPGGKHVYVQTYKEVITADANLFRRPVPDFFQTHSLKSLVKTETERIRLRCCC